MRESRTTDTSNLNKSCLWVILVFLLVAVVAGIVGGIVSTRGEPSMINGGTPVSGTTELISTRSTFQ